jgi:hypothetical protein
MKEEENFFHLFSTLLIRKAEIAGVTQVLSLAVFRVGIFMTFYSSYVLSETSPGSVCTF